ncbi:hypothetical protein AAFF_G00174500 [Aldrovandia affinis]|uniref:Uncharacterized protein n=1 Tax=Aldrovandia affinis TaxID=143900 RepID=A0AAD7W7L7_9TELE|nr:hypothetical protein AAFF_G00174500 [Aldrovandia affinis]
MMGSIRVKSNTLAPGKQRVFESPGREMPRTIELPMTRMVVVGSVGGGMMRQTGGRGSRGDSGRQGTSHSVSVRGKSSRHDVRFSGSTDRRISAGCKGAIMKREQRKRVFKVLVSNVSFSPNKLGVRELLPNSERLPELPGEFVDFDTRQKSGQLDETFLGQGLESEASDELATGHSYREDSLKNMLSDKDPMLGSASAPFHLLDNDDANFPIAGSTVLGLEEMSEPPSGRCVAGCQLTHSASLRGRKGKGKRKRKRKRKR